MIINFTGVSGSRVAYLASKEIKNYNSTLIVVSSGLVADRLREDISFFVPDISVQALPEKEDFHFLYEARDKDDWCGEFAAWSHWWELPTMLLSCRFPPCFRRWMKKRIF